MELQTSCYKCKHRRTIPGDAHTQGANPDYEMAAKANPHGIRSGWFFYPWNFDPVWRTTECKNWEPRDG